MQDQGSGTDSPPQTISDVATRLWLEILNSVAEYGTLVLFSAGAVFVEVLRRKASLAAPMDSVVVVAETVSAATMVMPKAIRAVSEIVHHLAVAVHDMQYVIKNGRRRPGPAESQE